MAHLAMWQTFLVVATFLLLVSEVAYRRGARVESGSRSLSKEHLGVVQGAVLGLLALLLGFTFSMAIGRYDRRRVLVVQEANNIRTTYLRASFLPPPYEGSVKAGIRKYVNLRIEVRAEAVRLGRTDPKVEAGLNESKRIQDQIWRDATAAVKQAPLPIMNEFIASLNALLDTDTERVAAGRASIPSGVWIMVLFVAGSGAAMTGFRAGMDGQRTLLASWFLPLLFTLVIILIYDFANPLQGLIGVGQRPMLEVQEWLSQQTP